MNQRQPLLRLPSKPVANPKPTTTPKLQPTSKPKSPAHVDPLRSGRAVAAERRLWHTLRERRFRGLRFARQVKLGDSLVADFVCADAGVVVELEGPLHDKKTAAQRVPHGLLEEHGWHVLRLHVDDVLGKSAPAFDLIEAACGMRRPKLQAGPKGAVVVRKRETAPSTC